MRLWHCVLVSLSCHADRGPVCDGDSWWTVAALCQGTPGQMTWLKRLLPWLVPHLAGTPASALAEFFCFFFIPGFLSFMHSKGFSVDIWVHNKMHKISCAACSAHLSLHFFQAWINRWAEGCNPRPPSKTQGALQDMMKKFTVASSRPAPLLVGWQL